MALKEMGPSFCGVTQLPYDVADEEIIHLHNNGVKATGFGRVELNVENVLKSIYKVNPDALMFGTDLPSTRTKRPCVLVYR